MLFTRQMEQAAPVKKSVPQPIDRFPEWRWEAVFGSGALGTRPYLAAGHFFYLLANHCLFCQKAWQEWQGIERAR